MRDATTATSHRYSVGEIEVIVVPDGERTAPIPEGFVLNAPIDEVKAAYVAHGIPEGHGNTPFNPTVIEQRGGRCSSTRAAVRIPPRSLARPRAS